MSANHCASYLWYTLHNVALMTSCIPLTSRTPVKNKAEGGAVGGDGFVIVAECGNYRLTESVVAFFSPHQFDKVTACWTRIIITVLSMTSRDVTDIIRISVWAQSRCYFGLLQTVSLAWLIWQIVLLITSFSYSSFPALCHWKTWEHLVLINIELHNVFSNEAGQKSEVRNWRCPSRCSTKKKSQ